MALILLNLFLLVSGVAQAECTFFTGWVDNKDGTVTDPRNGLIWKRCNEGSEFKNGECVGWGTNKSWVLAQEIVAQANQNKYLGRSDWRLPTEGEFKAVLSSDDCSGSARSENVASKAIATQSTELWSSSSKQVERSFMGGHPTQETRVFSVNFRSGSNINGKQSNNFNDYYSASDVNYVRLVRSGQVLGGTASPEFENELTDKKATIARQQAAEAARQRVEAQAYERKLAAFRKSLNEGDDTSSGVVIQVKGNLIKIQTNDSQCSQRNYEGSCTNYINTPAEKWFKRSEVYPK